MKTRDQEWTAEAAAVTTGAVSSGIELTPGQAAVMDQIEGFLEGGAARVFVLQGYAGTGKTFLLGRLAQSLAARKREVILLAPTGRAARVLRHVTGLPAATIHSRIYRMDELEVEEAEDAEAADGYRYRFDLALNSDSADAVYIVDESSMISDVRSVGEFLQFGSGRLLADLIRFVFGGSPKSSRRRLILAGDSAQLPPVSDAASRALQPDYLQRELGLACSAAEMLQVIRQKEDSPVLNLAMSMREALRQKVYSHFEVEPDGREIVVGDTASLEADLAQNSDAVESSQVIITHSNEAASRYNEMARRILFPGCASVQPGDRLLVVANCRPNGVQLYNGDLVRVAEVDPGIEMVDQPLTLRRDGGARETIRLVFRRVVLRILDEEGRERLVGTRIIENLLESRQRDLAPEEMKALFLHFIVRYPRLKKTSPEFLRSLQADPYFNALRVKYAYAVTCHKAQGGEWQRVIVDMSTGFNPATESFFRWAYTAITRTRRNLVVIHPPCLRPDRIANVPLDGVQHVPETLRVDVDRPRAGLRPEWLGGTPFHRQLVCLIADVCAEAGVRILDVVHHQHQVGITVERGSCRAPLQIYYNGGQRVTRILARPDADAGLARELMEKLSVLQLRTVVASSEAAGPSPGPAILPDSVPFPPAADQPGMARFDELFRPRILSAGLAIVHIDILNAYQARYFFSAGGAGRAALLYFFNGRGICTTCTVDARRTTDAHLAERVLALSRGGDQAP